MKYNVSQAIPFSTMDAISVAPLDFLGLVLADCRARLRDQGIGVFNADISIRPYPQYGGERMEGYDKSIERQGLIVIMTSETA